MEKKLFWFNNQAEFDNDKDKLDGLSHFASLKNEENESEFKSYKVKPEDFIKPISASTVADICLVDNSTLAKYIVDADKYDIDLFPAEQYTPIGIVVVPASHTDDGTARVMSLAAMNPSTPDSGSTEGHPIIYWGGYGYDISTLKNCQYSPRIKTSLSGDFNDTQSIIDWTGSSYFLSSDYYFGTAYEGPTNPYDTATCYSTDSNWCCPSPYLNDGSKNELYSQVYDSGGVGNIAEEMDGRVNTKNILDVDNSNSTAWQTAATISYSHSNQYIHPAAQCCWRYHTVGTTQGDWYLPASGELGYLMARWKAIDESIQKVISSGFQALVLPDNGSFWSSTEDSSDGGIRLYIRSDYCYLCGPVRGYGFYVRTFIAV